VLSTQPAVLRHILQCRQPSVELLQATSACRSTVKRTRSLISFGDKKSPESKLAVSDQRGVIFHSFTGKLRSGKSKSLFAETAFPCALCESNQGISMDQILRNA
jgi:hypothetical protein